MARNFERDPGQPFLDPFKEDFAKAIAQGKMIKEAARIAGVTAGTGEKWNAHEVMRARVRELRESSETFVGVSVGWILNELKQNVNLARTHKQLKVSNESLKLIYDIVKQNPDLVTNMPAADVTLASGDEPAKPPVLRLVESLRSMQEQAVIDMKETFGEEEEEEAVPVDE